MSVYNIYYSPTSSTNKVSDILSSAISEKAYEIELLKK